MMIDEVDVEDMMIDEADVEDMKCYTATQKFPILSLLTLPAAFYETSEVKPLCVAM